MRFRTRSSAFRASLCLAIALIGVACSDSDTSGGSDSTSASPTAAETTTAELSPTTDAPAEPFEFTVSLSEPTAIDPALIIDTEGLHVARLLFDTLVTLSPDLEVVPGVATAWSVSEDGRTWTFELNPEAAYSDGVPVVAADFAFAFARVADPDLAAPSSYQGLPIAGWADVNNAEPSGAIGDQPISGVVALDDHTLAVSTEEPFALLPKVLTYPVFAPVRQDLVDTEDKAAAFFDLPVGNGRYMMSEPWSHNEGITLVRNAAYQGEPGRADTIEFRIYSDMQTGVTDLEAGQLDLARLLPPPAVGPARESFPDTYISTRTGVLSYIGFPANVAPWDNPDIRLAFSLAIDREAIAERIYEGTASPATGVVPTLAPGALAGVCDACEYDPVRAKELFDAAGGVPGNSIVVYDIADDGMEALEPILNSWTEVFGIEIEVRSFEFGQFLEETAPGNAVGPFELGWAWDYPSGYSFLSPLFESTSDVNNLGWSDPAVDDLLRQAREASSEEEALEFLGEAQRLIEAAVPIAPVTFIDEVGVHSDDIENVIVDATGVWRLELVEPAS